MNLPAEIGPYRVLEKLKEGRRSSVFAAADRRDGSPCVLKFVVRTLLDAADVAALRGEFERLSTLQHPHLVRVLDFGETREWVWLASERVEGGPLYPADEETLVSWADVLLDALAYLHDRGILHHDLKPANVLIGPSGEAHTLRLIDLGLATRRYLRGEGDLPRGTRGYLAPELFRAGAVDQRVDLFALGALFSALRKEGEPSPRFSRWLSQLTAQNPEERFFSARTARAFLVAGAESETRLDPYLLESLPWASCRKFWSELSDLLSNSASWILLRSQRSERTHFTNALRAVLVARGVDVKLISTDAANVESSSGGSRSCFIFPDPAIRNTRRHLENLALRNDPTLTVLWLEPEADRPPPFGNWKEIRIAPYTGEELAALLGALHPSLHLEKPLIERLHAKTGGDFSKLRACLSRVLSAHPTVERFHQLLISDLAAWKPQSLDPTPLPAEDSLLSALVWAGEPVPLEWFPATAEKLSIWAQQDFIQFFEERGRPYIRATPKLENVEIPSHGDLSPPLLDLSARFLRRLLRAREYTRALAWVERLVLRRKSERLDRLRLRLLIETKRLSDARAMLEAMPDSQARRRLDNRLSFLAERFQDCPRSPEALTRLGRYREAYAMAVTRLGRACWPSRRAELERVAGMAAMFLGEFGAALGHILRSLKIARDLGSAERYTVTLNQLGVAWAWKGDKKRAARCYRHAASLAARSGRRRESLGYLLNLATVQMDLGEVEGALRNLDACRTSFRLLGLSAEEAGATQNLANFWIKVGNTSRASRFLSEADRWIDASGTPEMRIYQQILKADAAVAEERTDEFRSRVDRLGREHELPTQFRAAVMCLQAESLALSRKLSEARDLLGRSGADSTHRSYLLSEWEWQEKIIGPEEIESRLRGAFPCGESLEFFPMLKFLRFIALLARARGGLPEDLQERGKECQRLLRRNMPPDVSGALERQLARWMGKSEALPSAEPAVNESLASLSNEGQAVFEMFLDLSRRITGSEPSDVLTPVILQEMMRMTGAARGGIVLKRGDRLDPCCFLGEKWEKATGLPAELCRSVAKEVLETGDRLYFPDVRDVEPHGTLGASLADHRIRGVLALPLRARGETFGAVYLDDPDRPIRLQDRHLRILQGVADQAALALHTSVLLETLEKEREEVETLNQKLFELTLHLSARSGDFSRRERTVGIVGASPAMRRVRKEAGRAAQVSSPVLIVGESGTEKEALVRTIVAMSDRAGRSCHVVDCGALVGTLLEAELFGYEAGAFTGATASHPGILRTAGQGTVVLAGISAVPATLQVKLLRVLQDRLIRPLGTAREYPVDARFLATLDGDPRELIRQGQLREDVYFRLAVLEIRLPPLRERKEDIPVLVDQALREIAQREGKPRKSVTQGALRLLQNYSWPGNLRELENEVERAFIQCEGDLIDVDHFSTAIRTVLPKGTKFPKRRREGLFRVRDQIERKVFLAALKAAGGSHRLAAERLNISLPTFYRRLKRFPPDPEKKKA